MEFLNCCEFVSSQFNHPGVWEVPEPLFQPCRAEAKHGKETKAEPLSAKSILFSWLNKKKKKLITIFFKECWNFAPWFHTSDDEKCSPSRKKTPGGCGMLLP